MNAPTPRDAENPSLRLQSFLSRIARDPHISFEEWLTEQPPPIAGLRRSYAEWQLVRQFGERGKDLLAPLEAPPTQSADDRRGNQPSGRTEHES